LPPPPDIFLAGAFGVPDLETPPRAADALGFAAVFFTSLMAGFAAGFFGAALEDFCALRLAVTLSLGFALGADFVLGADFAGAFFAAALRLLAISFLPFVSLGCCHHHHMQPPCDVRIGCFHDE
jgi:hypothetical protein